MGRKAKYKTQEERDNNRRERQMAYYWRNKGRDKLPTPKKAAVTPTYSPLKKKADKVEEDDELIVESGDKDDIW